MNAMRSCCYIKIDLQKRLFDDGAQQREALLGYRKHDVASTNQLNNVVKFIGL